MGTVLTRELESTGDIGAVYETLLRELKKQGFNEENLEWPKTMILKRGKRGLLAKSMRDVKTTLNVSLKQTNSVVHVLLEYNLGVPSSFVDKSNSEMDEEILRIKHEIVEPTKNESVKTCDVCLNVIEVGDSFCKNCGRSSKPNSTNVSPTQNNSNNVIQFDENRIQLGVKPVDDALYGGIPKNSVVLISSPALEEKDILINSFIESGLDNSEIVVNVSAGIKKNNQKLVKDNKYFQIICNNQESQSEDNPNKPNTIILKDAERLTEISMSLTSILNNILKVDDGTNHKRLVIDIVSDVLLINKSVNTRKWLRETISKFKSKNFTILAILNPFMHTTEETQALLDLFEGQIDIREKEVNGDEKTILKIKRLDNVKYSSKNLELVREELLIKPNTAK